MTTQTSYCTFVVDGLLLGIEVRRVQEIIRHQPLTPVPLAPAAVAGLMNLRGQIVTAVDLRRRLGLRERPATALPLNVVVRGGERAVSFLVDEIGDVVEPSPDAFAEPPATLLSPLRSLVRSACKLRARLMLVLDIARCAALADAPPEPKPLTLQG